MDKTVDGMENGYKEFSTAIAGVLKAHKLPAAKKAEATKAALENFKKKWEAFRGACDKAEELVDSVKQSLIAERGMVSGATSSVASEPAGQTDAPSGGEILLEKTSEADSAST